MPAGRPTEYKREYAQQIIELMRQGLSLTAAAAEIGVWRQRIYEWAEQDEELADATKWGQALRTNFLEKRLLSATDGPTVTSSIFALKNSAPDEWRDKHDHELSGPNGGPMETVTRVELVAPSGDGSN